MYIYWGVRLNLKKSILLSEDNVFTLTNNVDPDDPAAFCETNHLRVSPYTNLGLILSFLNIVCDSTIKNQSDETSHNDSNLYQN